MQCQPDVGNLEPEHPPAVPTLPRVARYRVLRYALLSTALLSFLLCLFVYLRLARMIDRRLAEGPFSASTEILATPQTMSVGETMTPKEAVESLEHCGYTASPDSRANRFEEHGGAI